jgi:ZIP family zinc transporter
LVVFLTKKPSLRILSFGLGFSAGVMVFVSLVELLPQGTDEIARSMGDRMGRWVAHACFFAGIGISALIDKLVPDPENPHEVVSQADIALATAGGTAPELPADGTPRLARVGLVTALVIAIHNFPEGMATFVSAMTDVSLGLSVAVAVAVHNVPEGIAVAVPIYFATGRKDKAVFHSVASGLAEPLGALAVWLLLMPFINEVMVGVMLAVVSGIMVFISFDELLPTAREYGHGHTEIVGIVLGMAVMSLSLLLI